jgi:hypothetical protein
VVREYASVVQSHANHLGVDDVDNWCILRKAVFWLLYFIGLSLFLDVFVFSKLEEGESGL